MEEVIDNNIHLIMTQTNYTKAEAINKLAEHDNNYLNVIKEYIGIPLSQKTNKIKSVNQEIYKQIRNELNNGIKKYNADNPINLEHAIRNFDSEKKKVNY